MLKQLIVSFLSLILSLPLFAETLTSVSTSTKQKNFTLTIQATPGSQVNISGVEANKQRENSFVLTPDTYNVEIIYKGEKFEKQVEIIDKNVALSVSFIELTPEFYCNKKIYCKDMKNCAQVYYQFEQCGNEDLDRDKDGIPCENVCEKLENFVFIQPTT